jgi:hypothetical protein
MNTNQEQPNTALEQALRKHLQQSQLPVFENLLLNKILSRLDYENELKILKPKIALAFGIFLSGLTLLVLAFIFSVRGFAQTPTFHYLSLTVTDFKLILANWQDYSLGILESLPLGSLVLLLVGFLGSIFLVDFAVNRYGSFRKTLSSTYYTTH